MSAIVYCLGVKYTICLNLKFFYDIYLAIHSNIFYKKCFRKNQIMTFSFVFFIWHKNNKMFFDCQSDTRLLKRAYMVVKISNRFINSFLERHKVPLWGKPQATIYLKAVTNHGHIKLFRVFLQMKQLK